MRVAVAFRCQTEHERREDKYGYSLFRRSEAESLPHFIEAEAPDLFQLANVFKINSEIDPCAAAEPEPSARNAAMKGPETIRLGTRAAMCRRGERSAPWLPVGGNRINFLCEFIEANRGRSGRITQGDVRFGDLANVLGRIRE